MVVIEVDGKGPADTLMGHIGTQGSRGEPHLATITGSGTTALAAPWYQRKYSSRLITRSTSRCITGIAVQSGLRQIHQLP